MWSHEGDIFNVVTSPAHVVHKKQGIRIHRYVFLGHDITRTEHQNPCCVWKTSLSICQNSRPTHRIKMYGLISFHCFLKKFIVFKTCLSCMLYKTLNNPFIVCSCTEHIPVGLANVLECNQRNCRAYNVHHISGGWTASLTPHKQVASCQSNAVAGFFPEWQRNP